MPNDVLQAYVRTHHQALVSAVEGARLFDVEAVHDLRVATRRLRSTLRTFRPLLDRSQADTLRSELAWLADRLGAARDGDVLASGLAAAVAAEPPELIVGPVAARLQRQLAGSSSPTRTELTQALDSERFRALVATVADLPNSLPAEVPERRLRSLVRRAVSRADRYLGAAQLSISDDPAKADTALHAARKAHKRARYAVDVLSPVAGGKARRLSKRLTAVQDLLGRYQDTVVARAFLRELGIRAHLEGDNAFSYGLLHARQAADASTLLIGLPRAGRRAHRKRLRRWLDERPGSSHRQADRGVGARPPLVSATAGTQSGAQVR